MEKVYVSSQAMRADSSCPMAQQSLVEEAEQAFVEASFRQSLQLANKCLEEHSKNISTPEADSGHVLKLQTPLHLSFDTCSSMKTIQVCLGQKETDTIDRAAAIALQSWYEISSKATGPERSQGVRHLQPFLNVYSHHVMSLELMLIFLNFCRATDHFQEAVDVSSELAFHLFSFQKAMMWKRDETDELLIVLFTEMLPRCQTKAVVDLLRRFDQDEWTPSSVRWRALEQPRMHTLLQVLSFLRKIDHGWLPDTLGDCISRLESQLDDMESEESEPNPKHSLNAAHPQIISSSTVRTWKVVCDRFLTHIVSRIRDYLVLCSDHAQDRWKQRGQLAITVLTVWIAWRQRRRILNASKRIAIQCISKPIAEIVEALLPTGSR